MLKSSEHSDELIEILLSDVLEVYGYDFTGYSRASLKRRILRLYEMDKFVSFAEYRYKIRTEPGYFKRFLEEITINVTEKGKAEFVTFSGKDKTVHVGEDGETIQITGTSNSSKLTFSWSTNKIGIPNVTSFKVNNNTSATSGTAITGDPGATAQYTFKVSIVVPKNNTTGNRDSVLKVTCNTTSITDNFTISQMAGAAYLYLNSTGTTTASITIPQEGTSETVNVLSNTDWTFE